MRVEFHTAKLIPHTCTLTKQTNLQNVEALTLSFWFHVFTDEANWLVDL